MAGEMSNVKYEEEFILNSRGVKVFTCRWLPQHCESKAMIFLCHGYAMDSSASMKETGIRLAKAEGLDGLVSCFDDLVGDCSDHFTRICEIEENRKKMRILMGVSMGGAVVLLLHRKKPEYWDEVVLAKKFLLCKLADGMKPNAVVNGVLTMLGYCIPTWKIIPTNQDIVDLAFRNPRVRKEVRENPYCYKGKPRLQTGIQLMKISIELEKRLQEVKLPFLVVHGEDDKVTDPSASKLLYHSASSSDKTLKLYPGMWHDLLYGELLENMEIVFLDIIKWLDEKFGSVSRLEREQNK
ncbi:hypothetical protein Leryth_002600 [Lithospermum erythrorhizon]|nr:hypothetical protein Leryth_002600 [Lithospermum erythrorhizon]